jgi:hypothetical protein
MLHPEKSPLGMTEISLGNELAFPSVKRSEGE